MISRPLSVLSFVLVGAFLVPGCGQGEGGACQINADCAAGLECSCQLGGAGSSRGLCRPVGSMCGAVGLDGGHDAAAPAVDSAVDGGSDAGNDASSDGGSDANTDAGSDGGSDAAASGDVGTADATNDAG